MTNDVRKEYVERGMDGWYSITIEGWFPPSEFERLPTEEQINQRGYCVTPTLLGGLTFEVTKQIIAYLGLFVGEVLGGRLKELLLLKFKQAEQELYQIREETKDMKYINKFSVRDDGYPEWRKREI